MENSQKPGMIASHSAINVALDLPFRASINGIAKPRSRRKQHHAWDEADKRSNGQYGRNLTEIAVHFPELTLMELKICALIKSMKASWEIGDLLGISEHTIENHRVNIRKKIGLLNGISIASRLLRL